MKKVESERARERVAVIFLIRKGLVEGDLKQRESRVPNECGGGSSFQVAFYLQWSFGIVLVCVCIRSGVDSPASHDVRGTGFEGTGLFCLGWCQAVV